MNKQSRKWTDLYAENYRLTKKIEDDSIKMEKYPPRINIDKMAILLKATYRLMQSLSNYSQHFSQN